MFGKTTERLLSELREFASFESSAQRYIRSSLDIGLKRDVNYIELWARDRSEIVELQVREKVYQILPELRENIPKFDDLPALGDYVGKLIAISSYDLSAGKITTFSQYRFLYERLIIGEVRPLLPTVMIAAATLPIIKPQARSRLAKSISEAVVSTRDWSLIPPTFYPEWVEKV